MLYFLYKTMILHISISTQPTLRRVWIKRVCCISTIAGLNYVNCQLHSNKFLSHSSCLCYHAQFLSIIHASSKTSQYYIKKADLFWDCVRIEIIRFLMQICRSAGALLGSSPSSIWYEIQKQRVNKFTLCFTWRRSRPLVYSSGHFAPFAVVFSRTAKAVENTHGTFSPTPVGSDCLAWFQRFRG